MAHKIMTEGKRVLYSDQVREILCDTDADFATLPKCCPGSTAVSVASKNVYMVNASGRWVLFGGGSDGAPLEGDGAEYYTLAPTALSFRSTAPLDEFQEVQLNGETVDPANYTLEEGSTIVKLSVDYLKTLNTGNYEVAVVSKNTTVKGKFAVKAPELNEHGFYYNQPYTAYVDILGETQSFFIRKDGTLDVIGTPSGDVSKCTYTYDGNQLTVLSPVLGTLTGTIAENGTEIYCNELQISFELGNKSIAADEEYIYSYVEDLGGYQVSVIDKTKSSYGAIKTGIHNIPTVKLADDMFVIYTSDLVWGEPNTTLLVIPEIPNTITSIGDYAFLYCTSLTSVNIPDSVTGIGHDMFHGCTSLSNITFEGTIAQWNAITKGTDWNKDVPATYVQCSDGQVAL